MFTELLPLLKQRVLMITVSDIGDGMLRVNVIPRKLDADSDKNPALTTPLSITASADELDRELPSQLASFTESVVKTASNLEELKTQHAAAVKAVEAENKRRLDEKKNASRSKLPSAPRANPAIPESEDRRLVFGSKPAPLAGECRDLFDASAETTDARDTSGQSEDAPFNGSAESG